MGIDSHRNSKDHQNCYTKEDKESVGGTSKARIEGLHKKEKRELSTIHMVLGEGKMLLCTQLLRNLFQQLALIFHPFIDIVVLEQGFGFRAAYYDIEPHAPAIILLLNTRCICRRIEKWLR